MKWHCALVSLVVLASTGLAQEISQLPPGPADLLPLPAVTPHVVTPGVVTPNVVTPDVVTPDVVTPDVVTPDHHSTVNFTGPQLKRPGGFLTGDTSFPNFIGFVSNPNLSIDPRALTQIWPVYSGTFTNAFGPLPSGDIHAFGAGISVALSEELCVGLNRGEYVVSHLDKTRDGWLNLGGFVQYSLIRDVCHQFLLTAGLQWVAPSGSAQLFEGSGPVLLAPYFTFAKEFGNFHVLGTGGYQFPAGSGDTTTRFFFGNLHLDYRACCWLYPLVEFNSAYFTSSANVTLPHSGEIDIGTITADGNILTVAPGVNLVLVPNHLELGAVYETPIASQHNLHYSSVQVKAVLRY